MIILPTSTTTLNRMEIVMRIKRIDEGRKKGKINEIRYTKE